MKGNFDLERFNASQREAICHDTGPALVLAGPGSGKTTVITKRLQYLTEIRRVPAQEIMVVTFTKAAAREMQQRFESLTEVRLPVRFGTFHSIYYRILRESSKDSLMLLKEKEKQEYIRRILLREQIDEGLALPFLEEISRMKGGGAPRQGTSGGLPGAVSPSQMDAVFQGYRRLCREKNRLDFDDMAYECLELFERRPDILGIWQKRCRYILADEYQDIAPIQEKLLFLLALPENNLFLVGDDDQAIYGFRGAGTESMLSFPERYPDTRQIDLEMNYRCRPGIIQAAGKVIGENKSRFAKKQVPARERADADEVVCRGFPDRDAQNGEIVRLLRELRREGCLSRAAVLFRKNTDADALTGLLNRYKIPYERMNRARRIGEHFVTEDVTAYLRLVYGDRTRKTLYRIMNRPDRGLARESCGKETFGFRELTAWHHYDSHVIKEIQKLERDCRRACGMKPYAALMYIRKGMGYEAWLKKEYGKEALEECMQILGRLQELAAQVGDIQEWERSLSEDSQEETAPGGEGVHILTYHASKGLEFDHVIMPDLNEGTVPHKKAALEKEIEEERRMFYVGMTRARERLCLFYRTGTEKEPEQISRFLKVVVSS